MEKQYKMIQNVETGTIEEVELTAEELAEKEKHYKLALEFIESEKAMIENRKKALAKLAALGLTEDEIAAL